MSTGKHVRFVHNDPSNSEVVDGASGALLYRISTSSSLRKRTTTICNARGEVVALCSRGGWHTDVTYHGRTMDLSDWLPKKNLMSSSRLLTLPNGKVYEWKLRSMSELFQLVDADTKARAAEAHSDRDSASFLSSKRHASLDVSEALVPFLDAVVLAFIVGEHIKQKREQQRVGAEAAGAAVSAATA